MKKEDRNVALTVGVVLIVCTFSLVAIGSFLWQLVEPGVQEVSRVLGMRTTAITANYNFEVKLDDSNQEAEYNYNFKLPKLS